MATTVGRFDYQIDVPEPLGMPGYPNVYLFQTYGAVEDGRALISSELKTESEIDECIGALKRDLDHVGRRAKLAVRRANQKRHRYFQERRK